MALRSRPQGAALLGPSARSRSNLAVADKGAESDFIGESLQKVFFFFWLNLCDVPQLKSDPLLKSRAEELSWTTLFLGGGGRHWRINSGLAKPWYMKSWRLRMNNVQWSEEKKMEQWWNQRKAKLASTQICGRILSGSHSGVLPKRDEFCPLLIFSHSFNLVLSLSAVTLPPVSRTYLLCQLSSCIRARLSYGRSR